MWCGSGAIISNLSHRPVATFPLRGPSYLSPSLAPHLPADPGAPSAEGGFAAHSEEFPCSGRREEGRNRSPENGHHDDDDEDKDKSRPRPRSGRGRGRVRRALQSGDAQNSEGYARRREGEEGAGRTQKKSAGEVPGARKRELPTSLRQGVSEGVQCAKLHQGV